MMDEQDPAVLKIMSIHRPFEQEVETWIDGPGEELHTDHFPDCQEGCEGHTITIQVCNECGTDHDGDGVIYRRWPCPTVRAVLDDKILHDLPMWDVIFPTYRVFAVDERHAVEVALPMIGFTQLPNDDIFRSANVERVITDAAE